jgi:hypothetical protein
MSRIVVEILWPYSSAPSVGETRRQQASIAASAFLKATGASEVPAEDTPVRMTLEQFGLFLILRDHFGGTNDFKGLHPRLKPRRDHVLDVTHIDARLRPQAVDELLKFCA